MPSFFGWWLFPKSLRIETIVPRRWESIALRSSLLRAPIADSGTGRHEEDFLLTSCTFPCKLVSDASMEATRKLAWSPILSRRNPGCLVRNCC